MSDKLNCPLCEKNKANEQPTVLPKAKNKQIRIYLIICLLSTILICTLLCINKAENARAKELAAWNASLEENTVLSYSSYLVLHAEGIHAQEALAKIAEIRKTENANNEIDR